MITFNKLGKYGRFGNQLFQIASTIGIAKKHGYSFIFPYWKERYCFKNRLPFSNFNYFNFHPEIKLTSDKGLLIEYKDFECPDNVSLLGYFFSEKYFEHCKEIIRYYFEMKPIQGLPEIAENSICVHYRGQGFGTKEFPRISNEYYKKALLKLPDCPIYVFSDELETVVEIIYNLGYHKNVYYSLIKKENYIHDFYLMQKCKHFIIANSTFSWWAAWLGKHEDKIVIAPKNTRGAMYTDAMYPENWIAI